MTNPHPTKVSPSSTGDIGGQMGLFIGASLLTILEIFDYLYEVSGEAGRGHRACFVSPPPQVWGCSAGEWQGCPCPFHGVLEPLVLPRYGGHCLLSHWLPPAPLAIPPHL